MATFTSPDMSAALTRLARDLRTAAAPSLRMGMAISVRDGSVRVLLGGEHLHTVSVSRGSTGDMRYDAVSAAGTARRFGHTEQVAEYVAEQVQVRLAEAARLVSRAHAGVACA